MAELKHGHKNSETKQHNPIEFELVLFVPNLLASTLVVDGNQGQMMNLEDGYEISVDDYTT